MKKKDGREVVILWLNSGKNIPFDSKGEREGAKIRLDGIWQLQHHF